MVVDHKEYILWCAYATMAIYKVVTDKHAVVNDVITKEFCDYLRERYNINENKIKEILLQIRKMM